jgi:nitrogen fixation NifU-like protein
MSELSALYQEMILDHYRHPRGYGDLAGANRSAEGHNPLCGDEVVIRITVHDGIIKEARFQGSGCAISTASASLLMESVKGLSVDEAEELFQRFHHMLTAETGPPGEGGEGDLGKLVVLSGVRDYPMRVKCATLAWHTLRSALKEDTGQKVTTE